MFSTSRISGIIISPGCILRYCYKANDNMIAYITTFHKKRKKVLQLRRSHLRKVYDLFLFSSSCLVLNQSKSIKLSPKHTNSSMQSSLSPFIAMAMTCVIFISPHRHHRMKMIDDPKDTLLLKSFDFLKKRQKKWINPL